MSLLRGKRKEWHSRIYVFEGFIRPSCKSFLFTFFVLMLISLLLPKYLEQACVQTKTH